MARKGLTVVKPNNVHSAIRLLVQATSRATKERASEGQGTMRRLVLIRTGKVRNVDYAAYDLLATTEGTSRSAKRSSFSAKERKT